MEMKKEKEELENQLRISTEGKSMSSMFTFTYYIVLFIWPVDIFYVTCWLFYVTCWHFMRPVDIL